MFLKEKRKVNLNGAVLLFSCFFCAVFATIPLNPLATTQSTNAVPCNTHGSRVAKAYGVDANLSAEQRFMRDRPPSSYCVRIEGCSELITKSPNVQKYETRPFSVGGFNWYMFKPKLNLLSNIIFFYNYILACVISFAYTRDLCIGLLSSNRLGARLT